MSWTPEQIEKLRELWGERAPRDIGRSMRPYKIAGEVREKARELGLPAIKSREGGGNFRQDNRPYQEPIKLPDGMIELAPGHVCSKQSYELIRRA